MAYDEKYRERVLEYLVEGHTQRETAAIFKISRDTLQNWKRMVSQTGSLAIVKRRRKATKLPREELGAYVRAHPDAYLSEIAEHFGCTGPGVSKALRAMKITRKKRR